MISRLSSETLSKDGFVGLPSIPVFTDKVQEREFNKRRLVAGYRLFSKYGYDEGAAGHITYRDPIETDTFWVNPFGIDFSMVSIDNLIRCNDKGEVVEGSHPVNRAAFAIHSTIHKSRPNVTAAAHSHSIHGRAFSTLGKLLSPITQDSCAFYQDHALYSDYGGVAVELDEGKRITEALGDKKAVILQNHGLLTVGETIDEAVWWYIAMERCCQVQLLAEAAAARTGEPLKEISIESAAQASRLLGTPYTGWFQFQALFNRICKEQSI
eukprot:gene22389-28986_t